MTAEAPKGNYIAEWFGFRVWPATSVDDSVEALKCQSGRLCPFLTAATRQDHRCIKAEQKGSDPTGVCTISSDSNGVREEWLACPFRLLDQNFVLLNEAVRTVCKVDVNSPIVLLPISVLDNHDRKQELLDGLTKPQGRAFLFTAGKLGGEVDIPETDASPGGKVDFSVIEVNPGTGNPPLAFGSVMVFEIQTADFHGSPKHAIAHLAGYCPPGHTQPYHDSIKNEPDKMGDRVEGPNKANIFKRTIYQMLFKMEMARDSTCSGFIIVLPLPVWTSWMKHLGKPLLEPDKDDPKLLRLVKPKEMLNQPETVKAEPAWIFVLDIDRNSKEHPQPMNIVHRIATDAAALMYCTFELAVEKATENKAMSKFRDNFIARIKKTWKGKAGTTQQATK